MGDKVQDFYSESEFEDLLSAAEANAANDFETDFVEGLRDKYGKRMFLSGRQREILERIANDE